MMCIKDLLKVSVLTVSIVFCVLFILSVLNGCKKSNENPAGQNTIVGSWNVMQLTYKADSVLIIYDKPEIDSIGIIWDYSFNEDSSMILKTNSMGPLQQFDGMWTTSHDTIEMSIVYAGVVRLTLNTFSINSDILKMKPVIETNSGFQEGKWTRE